MEEKCVYCGGDLPEKPTKVKVRTRSFEVCCADCAAKTEQYIKLDKRFKTALYLLVFLGGIGFVISAFFGGDSPLRMIGAYAGQLVAGLAFIAFPYPVTSFELSRDEHPRRNADAHDRPCAERVGSRADSAYAAIKKIVRSV